MTQTTDGAGAPKCFKPLSHRDEERDAETFLRNKRGTLVPLCGPCYDQFMETCKTIAGKGYSQVWDHQEWLDRPESERKVPLKDGMAEFLEQEQARKDGSREGSPMTGSRNKVPASDSVPVEAK